MPKRIQESRRGFLIKGLAIAPVLALGGMAANAAAAATAARVPESGTGQARRSEPGSDYQPAFFSQEEFEFITAAVSRLIPRDERGPGALEAGVPEFIDRQLQTPFGVAANWYMQGPFRPESDPMLGYQLPLKPQEIYRLGIAEANDFSEKAHGKTFSKLSPEQQDHLLEQMETGGASFAKVPSKVFFATLLQNTREGFFCDPVHGGNRGLVGWKLIGFPGARADFMDWVDKGVKYPYPPVSISGERG